MRMFACVFIWYMVSTSLCAAQSQVMIDCAPVYSALNSYLEDMTPEHAEQLLALLQGDNRFWCQDSQDIRSPYFTTHSYLLEVFTKNHEKIRERLLIHDEIAIDLLFRWQYYMTDGIYAEDIDALLGRIIPDASEFFLLALQRNMTHVHHVEGIVFIDPERADSECNELQRRYTAVSQVNNLAVEDVKHHVLALFKEEIERRCDGIH